MALHAASPTIRDNRHVPLVADACYDSDIFGARWVRDGYGKRLYIDGRPFRVAMGVQVFIVGGDDILVVAQRLLDLVDRLFNWTPTVSLPLSLLGFSLEIHDVPFPYRIVWHTAPTGGVAD